MGTGMSAVMLYSTNPRKWEALGGAVNILLGHRARRSRLALCAALAPGLPGQQPTGATNRRHAQR